MIQYRKWMLGALMLAASSGLVLAQGPPEGFGDGPGPGFGGEGMNRMARMDRAERISRALKLNGDQKTQVKAIFQTSTDQSKPLQAELIENRQALAQLIKTSGADFDSQLQTLAKTQASLTSQLTVLQTKSLAQVWNLLTPEQKKKAEDQPQLFSPGMMGMQGGGMGMGRGQMGGGPMGGGPMGGPGGPPEM